MAATTAIALMPREQDELIRDTVDQHGNRLYGFIRNRVNDIEDAEDILQDVYQEFTSPYASGPIEQVAAWLFRVARNKIIDRYRKKGTERLDDMQRGDEEEELFLLVSSQTMQVLMHGSTTRCS
jgi:RNA polymerase sigma factor (sigma-70 family)